MVELILLALLIISVIQTIRNHNTALIDSFIAGYTFLVAIAQFGTGHWSAGIVYGVGMLLIAWWAYQEKCELESR